MKSLNTEISMNKRPETSLNIYFCQVEITKEEVGHMPGEYGWEGDETAPPFMDVVYDLVEDALLKSLFRLQPLLLHHPVDRMVVYVDVLKEQGVVSTSTYINSRGKVQASLDIGADVVYDIVKAYWDKGHMANPYYALALDSALIRAMDRDAANLQHPDSINPFSHYLNWMTGFRLNGLAGLTTFLRGFGGQRQFQKVEEIIDTTFTHLLQIDLDEANSGEELGKYLVSRAFVTKWAGELMMLHAIYVLAEEHQNTEALNLAVKGLEGKRMSDLEICQLVHLGLQVGHVPFILSLLKPGYKGNLFFASGKFTDLFKKLHVHHLENEKRYSDHILDAAIEKKSNLIQSFHNFNDYSQSEHKADINMMNKQLEHIKDNEDELLEIGSRVVDQLLPSVS